MGKTANWVLLSFCLWFGNEAPQILCQTSNPATDVHEGRVTSAFAANFASYITFGGVKSWLEFEETFPPFATKSVTSKHLAEVASGLIPLAVEDTALVGPTSCGSVGGEDFATATVYAGVNEIKADFLVPGDTISIAFDTQQVARLKVKIADHIEFDRRSAALDSNTPFLDIAISWPLSSMHVFPENVCFFFESVEEGFEDLMRIQRCAESIIWPEAASSDILHIRNHLDKGHTNDWHEPKFETRERDAIGVSLSPPQCHDGGSLAFPHAPLSRVPHTTRRFAEVGMIAWTPQQLSEWLTANSLPASFSSAFLLHGISGEILLDLVWSDFVAMGLDRIGDVVRLRKVLEDKLLDPSHKNGEEEQQQQQGEYRGNRTPRDCRTDDEHSNSYCGAEFNNIDSLSSTPGTSLDLLEYEFIGFRALSKIDEHPYASSIGVIVSEATAWSDCTQLMGQRGHKVMAIGGCMCVTARHECELDQIDFYGLGRIIQSDDGASGNGQASSMASLASDLGYSNADMDLACSDDAMRRCGCWNDGRASQSIKCSNVTLTSDGDVRQLWSAYRARGSDLFDSPPPPPPPPSSSSSSSSSTGIASQSVATGSAVLLGVMSHYKNRAIRQAWRSYNVAGLRSVNAHVVFFLDEKDNFTEAERLEYQDVVYFERSGTGHANTEIGMTIWELRLVEFIEVGLNETKTGGANSGSDTYEWFIQSDDDAFFCPTLLRSELDRLERLATLERPGIHFAHYIPSAMGALSDVYNIYNRHAARRTAELITEAGFLPKLVSVAYYKDYVDGEPDTLVVPDSRLTYGYLASDALAYNTFFGFRDIANGEPQWNVTGWTSNFGGNPSLKFRQYDGWKHGYVGVNYLPEGLRRCFCKCFISNHLTFIRDLPKGEEHSDVHGGASTADGDTRLPMASEILNAYKDLVLF